MPVVLIHPSKFVGKGVIMGKVESTMRKGGIYL